MMLNTEVVVRFVHIDVIFYHHSFNPYHNFSITDYTNNLPSENIVQMKERPNKGEICSPLVKS
jgi:hypothetical protein